jgi:hypothetical protein
VARHEKPALTPINEAAAGASHSRTISSVDPEISTS